MEKPKSPSYSSEYQASIIAANYNENFAMDINKRMRVPSQIMVAPTDELTRDPLIYDSKANEWMHVPERICVAGNERHLGTREPPPEFKLEETFLGTYDYGSASKKMISTPPRVLRIEDISPTDDNEEQTKKLSRSVRKLESVVENEIRSNDSILFDNDSDIDKDIVIQRIRKRFIHLDQRLDTIEIELARKNRRDFFLYTLGFAYLIFRGLTWFGNRNVNYL